MERPTPFDLVFADLAPDRFPAVQEALTSSGADPRDRDAFLLTLPAMQLLRELRPDDSDAGAGVDELAALVHHAFLAWTDGLRTWAVADQPLRRLLATPAANTVTPPVAGYIQIAERVVWASLTAPAALGAPPRVLCAPHFRRGDARARGLRAPRVAQRLHRRDY